MAVKPATPFPLFPPNLSIPRRHCSTPTEVRFSRWNNANAESFLRRQRQQKEIEDDIRRRRRFESATKIADVSDEGVHPSSFSWSPPPEYKSRGTPSSPSSPSIRGKASKYSKPEDSSPSHPAFRRVARSPRKARVPILGPDGEAGISVSDNGIGYRVKDAPFEFQYSYTETPKVKPLALREPPFLPFGPTTMPRPWTGRAPLPASKKKLPEFDSFRLPPPGKKGVKPVQAPGPYLAGSGPKYTAATREEILGEPLTKEEIKELIKGSLKSTRQLNIGRDGLTHNMLDNIHAHWKRRRVCKIKCKGVCTVDMTNVREQLEERTGGKIIFGRGGVLYLYRGRNYNYRTRPRYPLMLWKPMTPMYPRLVQRIPDGLTLDEATEMRKRGRQLPPICKLGKNGLYSNLVKNVREAFEECELVRINCKDMNKSDCRKIGAKLRDLVPCVLVSFEYEHILMWRGKEWRPSLPPLDCESVIAAGEGKPPLSETPNETLTLVEGFGIEEDAILADITESSELPALNSDAAPDGETRSESSERSGPPAIQSDFFPQSNGNASPILGLDTAAEKRNVPCLKGVMLLVERAVEAGNAAVLDDESLDADMVLLKSVALAKDAQSGPTFQHRSRNIVVRKVEKEKSEEESEEEEDEALVVFPRKEDGKKRSKTRSQEFVLLDSVPHGSLRVDQLAKLLA